MKSWIRVFGRLIIVLSLFHSSLIVISWLKLGVVPISYSGSIDFLKLTIGPLVGAGIAFFINDYVHEKRQREDEHTAVIGAAFAIAGMYTDFITYKFAIRKYLVERHRELGSSPQHRLAAYVQPHFFSFSEDSFPDLSSLHFLLHTPDGRLAFARIQALVRTYKGLVDLHGNLNEHAQEMQKKANDTPKDKRPVEEIVGLRLILAAEAFMTGVVVNIEQNGIFYEESIQALKKASEEYFGREVKLNRLTPSDENLLEENMPQLPKFISEILTQYGKTRLPQS